MRTEKETEPLSYDALTLPPAVVVESTSVAAPGLRGGDILPYSQSWPRTLSLSAPSPALHLQPKSQIHKQLLDCFDNSVFVLQNVVKSIPDSKKDSKRPL